MGLPTGVIILIVIAVIGFIIAIVRWVIATIDLGKSVVDGVKNRQTRKAEDEQFRNLTSRD